jgi:hypothetical protein
MPDSAPLIERPEAIAAWYADQVHPTVVACGVVLAHALRDKAIATALEAIGDTQVALGVHCAPADRAFLEQLHAEVAALRSSAHIRRRRRDTILTAPVGALIDCPDGPLRVAHIVGVPVRLVILTADGRTARNQWCGCVQREMDRWVRFERWSARGRESHGYLCSTCRAITQTG